jgi:hypothetical protein
VSRATQAFSLLALSALWLAIVIPGTTSEHGTDWEMLISIAVLPLAVLWGIFLFFALKKRPH